MASPDPRKSAETDVLADILDPDASVSFRDSVRLRIAIANNCSDPRGPPCREHVPLDNGMGLAAPGLYASETRLESGSLGRPVRVCRNKTRVQMS